MPSEVPALVDPRDCIPAARANGGSNVSKATTLDTDSTLRPLWPKLRDQARHGLVGEFLELVEPHSEADPAALVTTLIAAYGAIVGPGPHALVGGDEHPARIWPLIVGRTSKGRKGSAWSEVRRVLKRADPKFAQERVQGGFGSGEILVDAVAGEQDRRLLVVEPEYGSVLSRYKRETSTLATMLRQAWDGGKLEARSRTSTAVANAPHVVVVGQVTAEELLAKLSDSDTYGGSLNRFLIVVAERSRVLPEGGNVDETDLSEFVRKFVFSYTQARTIGVLHRTQRAKELWAEIYSALDADRPTGLLGAAIARDAPQMLRLQVAYALMDCSPVIDTPHVNAAQAVWDYCRAGAAALFGEFTGNPDADKILAAVRESHGEGLDRKAIHNLFGNNVPARQIDLAIGLLVSQNRTKETKKTTHAKGRPQMVLSVVADESNEFTKQFADHVFRDRMPVSGQPAPPKKIAERIEDCEEDFGWLTDQPPSDEAVARWEDESRAVGDQYDQPERF